MARSLSNRAPRFPGPKDIKSRLPGGVQKRIDSMNALGKRTWEDVASSIVRNGWPTSVRGRSLAIEAGSVLSAGGSARTPKPKRPRTWWPSAELMRHSTA